MDLSLLVKEALHIQSSGYTETVDNAISLLCKENGAVGNFTIENRLVKLEPKVEALVIALLFHSKNSASWHVEMLNCSVNAN